MHACIKNYWHEISILDIHYASASLNHIKSPIGRYNNQHTQVSFNYRIAALGYLGHDALRDRSFHTTTPHSTQTLSHTPLATHLQIARQITTLFCI